MSQGAKVWTALWAVYIIWGSTYLFMRSPGDDPGDGGVDVSSPRADHGAIVSGVAARCAWPAQARVVHGSAHCCRSGARLFFARRESRPLASIIASVPLWVVLRPGRRRARGATLAGVASGSSVAVPARSPGRNDAGRPLPASAVMWALGSFAARVRCRTTRLRRVRDARGRAEMLPSGLRRRLVLAVAGSSRGLPVTSLGVGYTIRGCSHTRSERLDLRVRQPDRGDLLGVLFATESDRADLVGAAIVVRGRGGGTPGASAATPAEEGR